MQEPNSKFNTRLNELGADGWELVTANEHIDDRGISVSTTFYFKREIETAPPNLEPVTALKATPNLL